MCEEFVHINLFLLFVVVSFSSPSSSVNCMAIMNTNNIYQLTENNAIRVQKANNTHTHTESEVNQLVTSAKTKAEQFVYN